MHAAPSTTVAARRGSLAEQSTSGEALSWCVCCGRPNADPLTGLMDRWRWTKEATDLIEQFGHGYDPITLLLADLDRFKSINDSWGHAAGDAVLRAIATVIRSMTRSGDLWGRYGSYAGDEFAGLLPGADLRGAVSVAERLQRHVSTMRIPFGGREITGLSMSVGISMHTSGQSLDDTFGRADLALLAAKRGGRDRVGVADASSQIVIASSAAEELSASIVD